ncbi:MAG: NAD(P)-dependent oxidoreductase [Parasporobacterium sp.]|nr:NAD(P)-dependent oxidoreductase [Parasporobacterium sp.]
MKIMIVGGTGFLGYYATQAGLKKGHELASFSLNDVNLEGWWPKEVPNGFGDVFEMTEDELVPVFEGYDAMIYSVGPDDRVTPKAPSYDFFHKHLVTDCSKVFRAARRAGVKRSAVNNSYFAYYDRLYPDLGLSKYHPYIRSRVEQAQTLIEESGGGKANGGMDVMVLELPYIFGEMPERMPLWKDVYIERFFHYPAIFFPKGGTTMIAVEHVGEAMIGAIENGVHAERYPVGDVNKTFRWMIQEFEKGLGIKKPIIQPSASICAMGANSIAKKEAKHGNEAGLDLGRLMKDVMAHEIYIPEDVIAKNSELLGFGRGGIEEAIEKTMKRCYPNGFGK